MIGHWDREINNKITRWTALPGGKMLIADDPADVVWEVLEDGTLLVTWSNQAKYTFTRDGRGWTGTSPSGVTVTLTRGNW